MIRIGDSKVLKKGLEVRREQLSGIQNRADEIIRDLKAQQTLLMRSAVKQSFQDGITSGIQEFKELDFPYCKSLLHECHLYLKSEPES